MKYAAQFRRLATLQRQLPGPGTTIKITGGLPPDYAPAQPKAPGSDLKHQHATITRAVGTLADTGQGVKIARRGS
jgi:hypothetical protein